MKDEKYQSNLPDAESEYVDLSEEYPLLKPKMKKTVLDVIEIFSEQPIDLSDQNTLNEIILLLKYNQNIRHVIINNKIILDENAKTELEKLYRENEITCQLRYSFDYVSIPDKNTEVPDASYTIQRFLRGLAARNQRSINKKILSGELKDNPLPLVNLPKKSYKDQGMNVRRVKRLDQNAIKKLGGKQIQQKQEEQQQQVQQQQRQQRKQSTRQQANIRGDLYDKMQERSSSNNLEKANKEELGELLNRSMLVNEPEKFENYRPELPIRPNNIHGIDEIKQWKMSCIISYWDNLVGQNAHRIKDHHQKIELIQKEAFEQILEYPNEFAYGLNLDNLPQGFYLREVSDEDGSKTVLCYSKSYVNQNKPTSPLAPTLKKKPIIQPLYHTVELDDKASVTDSFSQELYQLFPTASTDDRRNDQSSLRLFNTESFDRDKNQLIEYFKKCLKNEDIDSYNEIEKIFDTIIKEFNYRNFGALTHIFLHSGTQGVSTFLTQLAKLKETGHYEQFKKVFLDNASNFNTLNTLEARQSIEEYTKLSPNQLTWWNTLSEQHMKNNSQGDFTDLWKGFKHFLQELDKLGKSINKPLDLPSVCPFEDVKHMKVGLDRLLVILNRSLDPSEQLHHLEGLSLRQDEAYHAHRYNNYLISIPEMVLEPDIPTNTTPIFPDKMNISKKDFPDIFFTNTIRSITVDITNDEIRKITKEYYNNSTYLDVIDNVKIDVRSDHQLQKYQDILGEMLDNSFAFYKTIPDGNYILCRIDEQYNNVLMNLTWIHASKINEFLEGMLSFKKTIDQTNDQTHVNKLLNSFRQVLDTAYHSQLRPLLDGQNDLAILQNFNINYTSSLIDLYSKLTNVSVQLYKGHQTVGIEKNKTNIVKSFEHQSLLFLRYVAQQPYSLSIDQYKIILQKIASLNLDSTSNANMLTMIASSTTNKNQLQTDDIMHDIDEFIAVIRELKEIQTEESNQNAAHDQLNHFISCNWAFIYDETKDVTIPKKSLQFPSIKQLTTLFRLNDYPANRYLNKHFYTQFKKHTQLYGDTVYRAVQVLYDRAISLKPNFKEDYSLFLTSQMNRVLKSAGLNSEEKGLLGIVSLSLNFQNIDRFQENQANLCSAFAKMDNSNKRLNVLKVLASIDIINTETLPYCEKIIEVLNSIDQNKDLSSFVDIYDFISKELPGVKFNRMEVSEQFKSILDRFPPLDFDDVVENLKNFLTIDQKTEESLTSSGVLYNSNDASQKIRGLSQLIVIMNELTKGNPVLRAIIEKVIKTQVLDGVNKDFSSIVASKIDIIKDKNKQYIDTQSYNYVEDSTLDLFKKILNKRCPMIKYSEMLSEDITKGSQFVNEVTDIFRLIDQLQEHNNRQERLEKPDQKAQHDIELLLKLYNIHHDKFTIAGFTELVKICAKSETISADILLDSIVNAAPEDFQEDTLIDLISELTKHKDYYKKNFLTVLKLVTERSNEPDIKVFINNFSKLNPIYHNQLLPLLSNTKIKTNDINKLIEKLVELESPLIPKLMNYIIDSENCDDISKFNSLTTIMSELDGPIATTILQILNLTHFKRQATSTDDFNEMIELVRSLKSLSDQEIQQISQLYRSPPSPTSQQLLSTITSNPVDVNALMLKFEKDPPGHRSTQEKIDEQFTTSAVHRVIDEMEDLFDGKKIPEKMKLQLLHEFTFINAIGKDIPISTTDNQKKSLINFTTQELQDLIKQVQNDLQNPKLKPQKRHNKRLLYLALIREAMYRTTGKFPYSTQILSVLMAFRTEGNIALQINTGEGKTLINALNAAIGCAEGRSQIIPTSNLQLAKEGLEENQDFFKFLGHQGAIVEAGSPKETLIRGGINYTDPGNISLYLQQAVNRQEDIFEGEHRVDILIDETDFAMLDERTIFNFSMNLEGIDTHHNPHAWIYPLINDFIKTDEYKSLCSPQDDVMNLRRFIYKKLGTTQVPGHTQDELKEQVDKLSFKKLDRWIDSAVIASTYEEGVDFVLGSEQRMVEGKMTDVQIAHIVNENGSISTESKWSKGVHQFVHARLKLPIDAEMGYVSSESSKSLLDNFRGRGRIIGTTGTAGSQVEIEELRRKFELNVFKIPPHKKNLRQYLEPSFGTHAKFAFGSQSQFRLIKSALDTSNKKRDQQPVLIICKDISKAKEMALQLKEYEQKGYKVQLVTGEETPAALDAARIEASKKGVITISTPIFSRGTDIKTKHKHGLFVIQTNFDRFRMMCQILGRAARDGLIGYYQPIYNIEDISAEFGISLRGKSRKQKIALLEKIQVKLDKEAQMERKYSHHVSDINNLLQKQLNRWILKVQSIPDLKVVQRDILKIKEQMIADLEDKWNQILEQSDPNAEHPNPYIRYDQSNKLADDALIKCIEEYEKQAVLIWNEAQLKLVEIVNTRSEATIPLSSEQMLELLQFNADLAIGAIRTESEPSLGESLTQSQPSSMEAEEPNAAYLKYYPETDVSAIKQIRLQSFINQFKTFVKQSELCVIPTRQGRRLHKALKSVLNKLNSNPVTKNDLQKNISDYIHSVMDDFIKHYPSYSKAGISLEKLYEFYLSPLVKMSQENPNQAEAIIIPLREQLSASFFKAIESMKLENVSLITDLGKLLREKKMNHIFKDEKLDEIIYSHTDQLALLSNLKGLAINALSDYREQMMGRPVSADRIEAARTLEKEISKISIENFDEMLDQFNEAIENCFNLTLKADIEIDEKREKITGKAFTRRTVGRLRPLLLSLKEVSHSIRPVGEKKEVKDLNTVLEVELKKYNEILQQVNPEKRNSATSKPNQLKLSRIKFHKMVQNELRNPEHSEAVIKFLIKNKNHPLVRKNNFEKLLSLLPKLGPRP